MIEGILASIGKTGIVIQRKTVVEGDCSGDIVTWATLATITGAIKTVSGSEIEVAQKKGIEATHKLYCETIELTEKDRVLYGGIYYMITFIDNPMMMGKFLQIWLKRSDSYGSSANE